MENLEQKSGDIESAHPSSMRNLLRKAIILALVLALFITLILIRVYIITPANLTPDDYTKYYNLLHIPLELFSIVIAWVIFTIAWNSRQFSENSFFLFIGISFLFIGLIDLFHTLTYNGLFLDFSNWATQTWVAARYLHAISFLVSVFFIKRIRLSSFRLRLTFIVYGLTTILLLTTIFLGFFPMCYDDTLKHLTLFKILSEYIIIAILITSTLILVKLRKEFNPHMILRIILAIIFTIFSEYAFTLYTDVSGIANLVGHILKIISFYWIYSALIETSLKEPYQTLFRSLSASETRYRRIFEESPVALKEEDLSGIKKYLNTLKKSGVTDFRGFFNDNPQEVRRCAELVLAIDLNKAYMKLYNAENKEPFLKGLKNIFTEDSYEAFKEELIALAEDQLYFEIEAVTSTLNGNKNHIFLRLSVIKGHEATLSKVLVSVFDITERIEFENLRRQFVDTVSHELRTPISVITQAITNLQKYHQKLTPDQETRIMTSLSRNAELLTELIEDLLLVSRIDHEKIQLNWIQYNLSQVIFDVVKQLEERQKAKNINIDIKIDEFIQLLGDPARIGQICRILLDNAIKYSNENSKIEIKVKDHYQGKYNLSKTDGILAQFIDEGVGINEEDIPNLFKRFFRAKNVITVSGTGLGLAIARDLLHLHLGEIFVESTYGQGSTFIIFLPRLKTPPLV